MSDSETDPSTDGSRAKKRASTSDPIEMSGDNGLFWDTGDDCAPMLDRIDDITDEMQASLRSVIDQAARPKFSEVKAMVDGHAERSAYLAIRELLSLPFNGDFIIAEPYPGRSHAGPGGWGIRLEVDGAKFADICVYLDFWDIFMEDVSILELDADEVDRYRMLAHKMRATAELIDGAITP